MRNRDLRADDQVIYFSGPVPDGYSISNGDVLVGMDGEFEPVLWNKGPALLNQRVGRLVLSSDVYGPFIRYALIKPLAALQGATGATTVKHLSHRDVELLTIALPERREQERIADMLADADELLAAIDALIAKKRDVAMGVRQALLSGSRRLPGFADEWQAVEIGKHTRFLRSIAYARDQLDERGPVAYLHYGDIHKNPSVRADLSKPGAPGIERAMVRTAEALEHGDLVMVDASEDLAGVGKAVEITAVPTAGAVAGLHTIAMRFDPAVFALGFRAYLPFVADFERHLKRLASGTKVMAIQRGHVASAVVNLPSLSEQKAIAEVLSALDAEIVALVARREKTALIKQGMMDELLTGRTRLV